jgi:hypothetical protein
LRGKVWQIVHAGTATENGALAISDRSFFGS